MSKNNSKLYLDWLKSGLEKPGKSGKGLAAALGRNPSAVTKMLQNKRRIQASELAKIAEYIGEPVPFEKSGAATPASKSSARATLGSEQAVPLLRVSVVIAPAVWREVGVTVAVFERIAASPDPAVSGLDQYACKIEADNKYVVCVPYADMRPRPLENDVVHVRRTTRGHYEDTLRTVHVIQGRVHLQLEGLGEAGSVSPGTKNGETVEIRGLVVGYYQPARF